MSELINGKTPEEIKLAFKQCPTGFCRGCPYVSIYDCEAKLQEDTIAYIERLEAAQPKWISVKDRLPETDEWVAVWYRDKDGDCFPTAGRYFKYTNGKMYWQTDVDDNAHAYPPAEITHWMPLPELAKEDA